MNRDNQISPLNQLISKLENHTAVIGIVGLGYVGLPLMLRFVDVGFKVLGIDTDRNALSRASTSTSRMRRFLQFHLPSIPSLSMRHGT